MKRLGFIMLIVLLCFCCAGCEEVEVSSISLTTERTIVGDMVIVAVPKSFFFYGVEIVPDFAAIVAECAQYGASVTKNDLATFKFPATQWLFDSIEENRKYGVPDILTDPLPSDVMIHYPDFAIELAEFWEDSYLITLTQAQLQAWLDENMAQLDMLLSRFADNSRTSHMLIRDDLSVVTVYADTVLLEEAYDSKDIAELVQRMTRNLYLAKENDRAFLLNIRNTEHELVFTQEHIEFSAFIRFNPGISAREGDKVLMISNPVSVTLERDFFDASPFNQRCNTFEEIAYELSLLNVELELLDNRFACTMSQEMLEHWKGYYQQKVLDDIDEVCRQYNDFYDSLELSYSISDDFSKFTFQLNSNETGIAHSLWNKVSAEALNYRLREYGTKDITIRFIDKRDGFGFSTLSTG